MSADAFAAAYGVSRETLARLATHVELVERWTRRINLVAPGSLPAIWERHVADSAQLLELAPTDAQRWLDIGSGAGFPGLVIAALAAERAPGLRVTLVESDARKCAFLAEAARAMDVEVDLHCARAEALAQTWSGPRPQVVSARAVAPLDRLCALAWPLGGAEAIYLFPKGARVESELTAAVRGWHIVAERIASRTDPAATILRIRDLRPREVRGEPGSAGQPPSRCH